MAFTMSTLFHLMYRHIMYHITSCIDIYVLLNIQYMLFDSIQLGLLINHTKVRNTEFYKEQI